MTELLASRLHRHLPRAVSGRDRHLFLVELPLQGPGEKRGMAHRLLPCLQPSDGKGDRHQNLHRGDGQRPLSGRAGNLALTKESHLFLDALPIYKRQPIRYNKVVSFSFFIFYFPFSGLSSLDLLSQTQGSFFLPAGRRCAILVPTNRGTRLIQRRKILCPNKLLLILTPACHGSPPRCAPARCLPISAATTACSRSSWCGRGHRRATPATSNRGPCRPRRRTSSGQVSPICCRPG